MKNKPDSDQTASNVEIDYEKRKLLIRLGSAVGGVGIFCLLGSLFRTWLPNKKTQALGGTIQVSVHSLKAGEQLTVQWRGRPVWIIRRSKAMIRAIEAFNADLRDPNSLVPQQPAYAANSYRSIKPEYLVVVGVCTHLGCIPHYLKPLDHASAAGFRCPCHGSVFDLAGRVFKNMPAPINLEIPPHRYINEHLIEIGY